MKRVFLLVVILGMCLLVTVGGTMTFLSSNSVLKNDAQYVSENVQKSLLLSVDLKNNRMFLLSKGKVIKSYQIKYEKHMAPSPSGDWKIVTKDTIAGEIKWLGVNIPWGRFGIHGEKELFNTGLPGSHGCIKLDDNDMQELYSMVRPGTTIKIYGSSEGTIHGKRILKPGDRGADVYEIQRNLKAKGYFDGYLNGIYNKELQLSIHEFQRKSGLEISDYLGIPFYIRIGMYNNVLLK